MLQLYLNHQIEIIERRTKFRLEKAQARAHILEGLKLALDNIDSIIKIIRTSKNDAEAMQSLIETYEFSQLQAKAILDMRLSRLTGLAYDKLESELNELLSTIDLALRRTTLYSFPLSLSNGLKVTTPLSMILVG